MPAAYTIRILFQEGDPNGLHIIDRAADWTGVGIAFTSNNSDLNAAHAGWLVQKTQLCDHEAGGFF